MQLKNSFKQFESFNLKRQRQSQSKEAAKSEKVNADKVLDEFPLKDRLKVVLQSNMLLASRWKEAFDVKRNATVPGVSCIICERKFFADSGTKHSETC